MSTSNPCLVGIVLVIKKKAEPHLVFHYPPHPGEDNSHFKSLFKDDLFETTSSSSEDEESAPEDERSKLETNDTGKKDTPPDVDETGSVSPQKEASLQQGNKRPMWNDVLGYKSIVLAKALCPATGNYKRFEMSFGNNVVIGRPTFIKEDGSWRRKREPRRRSSSIINSMGRKASLPEERAKAKALSPVSETSADSSNMNSETEHETTANNSQGHSDPPANSKTMRPSSEDFTNFDPDKVASCKAGQQATKASMVMFHVAFFLKPPPLEYHDRIKDIYDHVIKRFTRALKWEQARSGYVAKEAALISSAAGKVLSANKDNPPLATLYHDIMTQSSLAKAIASLYNSISNSRIAHISLTPSMSLSLQIPIPTSISILPTPLSPQMPGLWLTTTTSLPSDEDIELTGSQLGSHFTLLLLSDLHTILADLNAAASPITGPLTHFLRVSKSTKSFLQISQASGIALSDIQFLASHLVYWRRARAIPPLRQADIYILSPIADLRDLASASSRFAKTFPIMPPLPRILSMLSTSPKPYSTLIPNKDRKEVFMEILAWLLRGGWVTQLRTFAWVRVPSNIKPVVDGEEEQGETNYTTNDAMNSSIVSEDYKVEEVPDVMANSPTSSTHTALPIMDSSLSTSAILISNPLAVSAHLSRYLAAISRSIGETQGPESKAAWEKCLKYFDGKHAIETIAVREGWKRKRMMEFTATWEGLGFLSKTRHW